MDYLWVTESGHNLAAFLGFLGEGAGLGNPCGKVERLPLLRLNDFAQPFRREFAQLGKGIDAGIVEPFGIDLTNTMNVRQGVWARRNGRRNRGNGYLALQVTNFEASCFQFPSQPALFIDTDILFLTPEAPVDNPFTLVSGKNESKNRLVTPMGGDALG